MNINNSTLRDYLASAKKAGQYLQIDQPVDVATEVGTLCSQTKVPTLFANLKGFEGFQLVDCLTRFRDTQALALGINADDPAAVLTTYLERLSKGPGPTIEIEDAPIKEQIWLGDDASLHRLPIPTPSEGIDYPQLGLTAEDFVFPCIPKRAATMVIMI